MKLLEFLIIIFIFSDFLNRLLFQFDVVIAVFFGAGFVRATNLDFAVFKLDELLLTSVSTAEENVLTVWEAPHFLLRANVHDMEVFDVSVEDASFLFNLNALFYGVAQIVFEKTRVFQSLNFVGVRTQIEELVGQIMEPNNDKLVLAVALADIVKTLGIVADTEHLVSLEGWHTERGVFQSRVAHQVLTRRPDRNARVVISTKSLVRLAELFEGGASELDAFRLFEHVACVLTVFTASRALIAIGAVS